MLDGEQPEKDRTEGQIGLPGVSLLSKNLFCGCRVRICANEFNQGGLYFRAKTDLSVLERIAIIYTELTRLLNEDTQMVFPAFTLVLVCFSFQSIQGRQESVKDSSLPAVITKAKSDFDEHLRLARERYEFEQRDAFDRLSKIWEAEITRARRANDEVQASMLSAELSLFLESWRSDQQGQVEFENSIGMKMILVRAGSFNMGSPADEIGRKANEKLHQVTIAGDYFMGAFEVTQSQFEKVMGIKPSYHLNGIIPSSKLRGKRQGRFASAFPYCRMNWRLGVVMACQPKPNGSMPAARERARDIPLGIRQVTWESTGGSRKTLG